MRSRGVQLIVAMVAALLLASGVALALNEVDCSKNDKTKLGSTSTNPCLGTNSDDRLIGTAYADYIIGGPTMNGYGDDIIEGRSGDDKLYGGYGDDTIKGEEGDDTIDGGYNRDTLDGGDGNDKIYGYYNRDGIVGGKGTDEIYGGNDADNIDAVDGAKDAKIDCGSGTDTVKADAQGVDAKGQPIPLDQLSNCENITWVVPSPETSS